MDPTYPLYPIFVFLSTFLVLIPLPWHLFAWNVGTCAYMIWTAISCLNQFVNSVVWKDNVDNVSPGWCDISSRIILASSVAIPACSLAITRRLYNISRVSAVLTNRKDKIRDLIIDLSLVVGLPILIVILYYFIQVFRFQLLEEVGCIPAVTNAVPAFLLFYMWPLVLGTISSVYCFLTIRTFLKRRRELSQFLSSNSQITPSRYFRLMALAMMDTTMTVPLSIFVIITDAREFGMVPYVSLAFTRKNVDVVPQIPSSEWRTNQKTVVAMYLNRWVLILCAIIFVGFFGFADESRKNYAKLYWAVMRRFGYERPLSESKAASFGISSSIVRTPQYPAMYTSDSGLKIHVHKYDEKRQSTVSLDELSSSVRLSCEDRKDGDSPTHTYLSDSFSTPTTGIPRLPNYSPSHGTNRQGVPNSFVNAV